MLRQQARAVGAALVAVAISLSLGTATSSAAKAPASFYGVVPQTNLDSSDFDRMGEGKVGTLRTILNWSAIDPTSAAGDDDWSSFDPIVLEAADNGIDVLPFIYGTPTWVAKDLDNQKCSGSKCVYFAPKSSAGIDAFKTFVGEVVERYGPDGEFWTLHPEVPKDPIEIYQILNEQNSETFFAPKPSTKLYAKLLAAAADAIKSRDPSAQVVLGGMAELAGSHKAIIGSKYLADLYKVSGVKDSFDGVAPHPYGGTIGRVADQIELYRKVMKHAGDSGADMYVTEIGAGSANGGSSLNRGTDGQASLLTDIYKYFLKHRNGFNVQTVDWFSWMDSTTSICDWCKTSGLLKKNGKAKPSYKAFTKLTGGSAG
ncbi:MAG: polysaccharide biosynthesis protein PslG [Solirubrobacterales bacterium]|nr:polysaccharide biosynthesis protein PslG [Solirubrobacterales bacterium]